MNDEHIISQLKEQNRILEQRLKIRTQQVNLLYNIGQEISSSLNINDVLESVVDNILSAWDAEICSVLLYDSSTDQLKVAAAIGLDPKIINTIRIKPGESISGSVYLKGDAIFVKDIEHDNRFAKKNVEKYYTHSLISAALVVKGKSIGVINVNNKESKQPFCEDDLYLIKSIAAQAAAAVENARLFSELEATYLRAVLALTTAIDARDHYTSSHSEHVTAYALAIAKKMDLSASETEMIKKACQLHDIGKISINDSILTKPGKLNAEEWAQIKQHTLKGAEILKPLIFLNGVIDLVKEHHERFDGKGYPFGIQGEKILKGARIIAVADSYDAMTTKRPYSNALTREEAIAELNRNKEKQFDPEIVDAFLEVLKASEKS